MTKCFVGFSYPKKFKLGAWLISFWMKKDYSHAYLRFESDEISTVYQASHGMVHFREFSNFKEENNVIAEYSWDLDRYNLKQLMLDCVFLAGEEYAYKDLPVIFIYDITGLDLGDNKGYVCSSLVAKLYSKYTNLRFCKPIHLVRPDNLEDVVHG